MQVTHVLVPTTRNGIWVMWNTQWFYRGELAFVKILRNTY